MTTSEPTERVLAALRGHGHEPKRSGSSWACRCPAHDDRNPSLSIHAGGDGRALVCCHAGCPTPEVLKAVGLTMPDLMPDSVPAKSAGPRRAPGNVPASPVNGTSSGDAAGGGSGSGDTGGPAEPHFATACDAVAELERRQGPAASAWTYTDVEGEPVGVVLRWETRAGKSIRPVSRDGRGWALRGMPPQRPLYQLDKLHTSPAGSRVHVVEGEKCAEALASCGLLATTSPHGSKSAAKADWSPLAGRDVVILPDADEAGEKYAEEVMSLAHGVGAQNVRIIRLSDHWPDLPEGGDAADALDREGGDAEAVRAGVEALIAEAEPEPTRAPSGPPRFEPFPVDVLPEPIRGYVTEAAGALGCDPCYVALPLLSALAGAIGNTRRLAPKRSWTEPAIVWTAIIGESGSLKSPALELALRPVRHRQHRAMKEHERAVKQWEADHARWEVEYAAWKKAATKAGAGEPPEAPEKPVCPRTWTDDTTTEALVARLKENPRGLLMARDELSGWLDFDRYAGGRGGGDAAKWLEVFGGRALIVDRKTSGTEYVPRASVSIAGGIQPETLRRALGQEHRDNGLAARLLFAMPPRRPKRWTEDDVSERTEAAVARVFDHLYALESDTDAEGDAIPRLLALTAAAKAAWIEFVNRHGAEQADRVGDEAAAWSKLEAYAARFALVFHMARVAAGDPTIADAEAVDEHSIAAGVQLVRWFAREAERVYALFAGDDDTREQARLLEWIEGRGGTVTASQLAKGVRRFRGEPAEARHALDELVEAGLGRWEHPAPGPKGGRPSQRFVLGSGPITPSPVIENPREDPTSVDSVDGDTVTPHKTGDRRGGEGLDRSSERPPRQPMS